MKVGLRVEREPVPVPAPSKRSSTWESAVRRWLSRYAPAEKSDLEDVAEEVFARLSRYGEDELIKSPQKFVLLVAANVVDERRGDLNSEGAEREALIAEDADDERHSNASKLVKQVRAAVEALPARQRRMLLMHVNDGVSYHQIAQAFQMTPRLVQRDLARAYAAVRSCVGEKSLDEMSV